MKDIAFTTWCSNAVSRIGFPPDRKAVQKELFAHMEDHYDDLISRGLSPEEAERRTVEAMGDAREVAGQLAQIHRPFWGYFLRVLRISLVAAAAALVILAWDVPDQMKFWTPRVSLAEEYCPAFDSGRLLLEEFPEARQTMEGYTFSIPEVIVWETDGHRNLAFQLEHSNPRFWAGDSEVCLWFSGEDSLGNAYLSQVAAGNDDSQLRMSGRCDSANPFRRFYRFQISDFPAEADWLDICYTRDGRDLRLHIDLTGGVRK